MKFDTHFDKLIDTLLSQGHIPFLVGEAGIGKSSYLQDYAKKHNTRCFTLACNQLADKADLTGARPTTLKTNNEKLGQYKMSFFPHEVIFDAIAYAYEHPDEMPILFMDELNRTTPDVTSEALSIPTMRQIGSTALPDNLRVVIAGNNKGNITALDTASINRFVVLPVTPSLDTFLHIHPDLNAIIKEVLETNPTYLLSTDNVTDDGNTVTDTIYGDDDKMEQIASPRSIAHLSEFLNQCTFDDLLLYQSTTDTDGTPYLKTIVEGYTGSTLFSLSVLKAIQQKLKHQIKNATSVKIEEPASWYKTQVPTLIELKQNLNTMSDQEKEDCFIYALSKFDNNADFIEHLQLNTLSPNAASQLYNILQAENIYPDNEKALYENEYLSELFDEYNIY